MTLKRPSRPSRPSPIPLLLLGLGALAFLKATTFGATAYFSDRDTVGFNRFVTGRIDIDARPDAPTPAITMLNMVPGDQVTDDLEVRNIGTHQLRYAVNTTSTNPDGKLLRNALRLTIRTEDAGGGCAAFTGTQLYTGTLANGRKVGNPAAGTQAGDRVLNAGASERLCVRVALLTTAGNTLKNAQTVTTFTFRAEQTAYLP